LIRSPVHGKRRRSGDGRPPRRSLYARILVLAVGTPVSCVTPAWIHPRRCAANTEEDEDGMNLSARANLCKTTRAFASLRSVLLGLLLVIIEVGPPG
jgi:hypothetical protein